MSTFDKLPFLNDELRKISDEKPSSNSSPSKLISRSSSRLTFWGGYDDSEFLGPFVLDNDAKLSVGSRINVLSSVKTESCLMHSFCPRNIKVTCGYFVPRNSRIIIFAFVACPCNIKRSWIIAFLRARHTS
ncbi:uncharacterized protein [Primulina eburnea]|uniref:uncharacterized protein isoform X2 n=1 Tax=Primulina eburnea TaxID=1245227 RepID=UPI003C6BE445